MKRLRIAVVGCGRMGQIHARNAAALGHGLALACDVDASRAQAVASAHPGCRAVTALDAIDWARIDAAFICTPPFARGDAELRGARAGVALFLEKPVGLSANQLAEVAGEVQRNGTVTSVGYMNRYRASVRRAKEELRLTAPLGFSAHWIGAAYKVPWWGDPALSGGQVNEQCTHIVDLARHLMGEVVEVRAMGQPHPTDRGFSSASILLRFDSGALATLICGSLALEKQIGCRVFTARGQWVLDGWDFQGVGGRSNEDVFLQEAAAFLAAAGGSLPVDQAEPGPVLCELADALKTQEVADAVRTELAARLTHREAAR